MNFVRKHGAASCALGTLAFAASLAVVPAYASTASGTLTVTASVATTCTVTSPTLAFGSYSGTELDQQATIGVTCTAGSGTAQVTLDNGANAGKASTYGTRALQNQSNATEYLGYDIYTDSGHNTVWNSSTSTQTVTETGTSQTLTAYGKLPAGQTLFAGSYSDTVGITVTF